MKRLAIIGSLDLAQLIAYHYVADGHGEIAGFFDDFRSPGDLTPRGAVLGPISQAASLYQAGQYDCFIVGVGYKHREFRRAVFESLSATAPAATLVHSSSYLASDSTVAPGSVVLPGCTIDSGCTIEANVVLNTGCVIAHDSRVGAHTFLGPGVNIAGFVSVGSSCFIGVGTTVIDNVKIADGTQTGGGAVVVADITKPGLYLGVPAKLR